MIDTKALRSRVLDLAIQGRLTEHHNSNEWKLVQFGDLFSLSNGTASRGSSEGKAHPVIRLADLKTGQIEIDNIRSVVLTDKEYASHILKKNDLIIIRVNGSKEKVATAFLYDYNEVISYCDHLFCARSITDMAYEKYIILIFNTDYIRKQIYPRIKTTAGQNTISQANLNCIDIPLPPLAEQKRIVTRVEDIFRLLDTIDEAQKQYAIDVESLKAKLITAGIQGKLTEQLDSDGTAEELYQQIQAEKQRLIKEGKIKKEKPLPEIKPEEVPFEIPGSWKWVRLGNIVTVLGGKRIPAGRSLTTDDTGHKYIRVSDMKNLSVDTSKLLYVPEDIYPSISRYIINKEDVYITVAGTIGRVGTIPDEIDGANLTENADRLVFTELDKYWLVYCLYSNAVQKQIEFLTTQVAQPKLAIKKIQEFEIPLPPLAEQKRIAEKLDAVLGALS